MTPLWIVAAVDAELALIRAELNAHPAGDAAGVPYYHGRMGARSVYLGVLGVGVVSAAMALGAMAQGNEAREVIMVGSAGAYSRSGLELGDLVVGSSETFAELGLCLGVGLGDSEALGLSGIAQEIAFEEETVISLARAAGDCAKVKVGRLVTVAGASADASQAEARERRFNALAENMEGYALALAGRRFGIRVGQVRAVSNQAGNRDKSTWRLDCANERAQEAVLQFLRSSS